MSKEEAAGCLLTLAGVLPAIGVVVVVLPLLELTPEKEDFPDELAGLLEEELPPLKEDLFPEEELEEEPPKADLLPELGGELELPPLKEDLFPDDELEPPKADLFPEEELEEPPLNEDLPLLLLDEEPPEKEDLPLEEDGLLLLLPPEKDDLPLEEDEPPENEERPEELLLDDRPDEEEPPENEDRPEEDELLNELDRLPPPF